MMKIKEVITKIVVYTQLTWAEAPQKIKRTWKRIKHNNLHKNRHTKNYDSQIKNKGEVQNVEDRESCLAVGAQEESFRRTRRDRILQTCVGHGDVTSLDKLRKLGVIHE